MAKQVLAGLLGVVFLGLTTGCAVSGGETTSSEVALTESFSSLEELSQHASLIVQGVAAGSEGVTAEGTGFEVTEVEASRVFKGKAEAVIHVRQTADGYFEENYPVAPLLISGTEYVLYLKPFELVPGDVNEGYVVLGVGAFEVDGGAVVLPDQADYYEGFPERTSLEEIEELARQ